MDIFDLSIEEFEKEMKVLVESCTPEELLEQLKECGYQQEEDIIIRNVDYEESIILDDIILDDTCKDFTEIHNSELKELGVAA